MAKTPKQDPAMLLAKLQDQRKALLTQKANLLRERAKNTRDIAAVERSIVQINRMIHVGGKDSRIGIVEGAEMVFEARKGAPMTMRDLVREMEALGVHTESKRFGAAVYATLRLSPKFVRLPDRTWQRAVDAPEKIALTWSKTQGKLIQEKEANRTRS